MAQAERRLWKNESELAKIEAQREKLLKMGFSERVYTMLEDAEVHGFDDIVRWGSDGQTFKVHKVKEFEDKVQPIYLKQTRLRSLQRQVSNDA